MSFEDHIAAPAVRAGRGRLVDQHLANMPADEAEAARRLLATHHANAFCADAFTAEGYPVSQGAIRLWRKANQVGIYAEAN